MKENGPLPTLRVSGREYLARIIRTKCARWLSDSRRGKDAPRIACFPGDDIGDSIISNGLYEDIHLHSVFDVLLGSSRLAFKSTVAIDVGANIGNHAMYFARRFKKVLAFEPSPIASRLLEASVIMNRADNISVHSVALGNEAGQAMLHVSSGQNLGKSGLSDHLQVEGRQDFLVSVVVGDSFVDQLLGDSAVGLIKIDVEGFEVPVIEGLRSTISSHRPVLLFEYHPGLGCPSPFESLEGLGYSDFYSVSRVRADSWPRPLRWMRRLLLGDAYSFAKVDPTKVVKTLDMVVALPLGLDAYASAGVDRGVAHVAE